MCVSQTWKRQIETSSVYQIIYTCSLQLLDLDVNVQSGEDDALPADGDTHGTNVVGVIGMEKSNGVCGVGVAYNSHITGR